MLGTCTDVQLIKSKVFTCINTNIEEKSPHNLFCIL